jgi:hypothetical protein
VGEAVVHALTDRRLLVIKCHEVVQAFELDVMRRLLAAVDALPASVPADEHVLDPSKVRPLTARPAEGVTEFGPILHMLRAFGQVQAPASKSLGACLGGAPTSDDIGNAGPAPAWLGEPLLQPGENVVVWGGPREGRLKRWLRLLKVKRLEGFLVIASMVASFAIFPFAGIGLFRLLGWADGGPGLYLGLTLALGCVFATIGALIWTEQGVFHVLTDRRLLVVVCRKEVTVQAFDLDVMRRLLAAVDAARPASVPKDEHLLDPSKVQPLVPRPTEGLTAIEPVLELVRQFGQLQPAAKQ